MKGINKVIIVGYLGKDPETRYTTAGKAITSITVATSESWKDKDTGEKQEKTEWHRVMFFNRLAEVAGEYLKKGALVYVEGALSTRKWEDKEGITRYSTDIIAAQMQMLGGKSSGEEKSDHQGFRGPPKAKAAEEPAAATGDMWDDSDIPF